MRSLTIILFIFIFSLSSCQNHAQMIDKKTVTNVDIEKYMGTWYEIARFPHSFEKGLVGVTATYTLKENGKIQVVNQGYLNSFEGKRKIANGKAKIPNPDDPGKLKVAFFLFFYADYYILELEENYQWALIGSSSDNYLWILSRTPQIEEETLQFILGKAKQRGYNLDKLIMVEQKAN